MAFSKQHKGVIQEQYVDWLKKSQAMIMVEYSGLNMKGINAVRAKAREAGGEFHVVKNTLLTNVFKAQNIELDDTLLTGSTAVGFAFSDAPAMAKAMTDFVKGNDVFKVKGGYLGDQFMDARTDQSISRSASAASYACKTTWINPDTSQSTGSNIGRTRSRVGIGGQGVFREGSVIYQEFRSMSRLL